MRTIQDGWEDYRKEFVHDLDNSLQRLLKSAFMVGVATALDLMSDDVSDRRLLALALEMQETVEDEKANLVKVLGGLQ